MSEPEDRFDRWLCGCGEKCHTNSKLRLAAERDEARAARNQLHADFCATDEALEKVIAQRDALRDVVEPLIDAVVERDNGYVRCHACGGWWHLTDVPRHRADCPVLAAIVALAQLPTEPSDTPECPPPERPPGTSSP